MGYIEYHDTKELQERASTMDSSVTVDATIPIRQSMKIHQPTEMVGHWCVLRKWSISCEIDLWTCFQILFRSWLILIIQIRFETWKSKFATLSLFWNDLCYWLVIGCLGTNINTFVFQQSIYLYTKNCEHQLGWLYPTYANTPVPAITTAQTNEDIRSSILYG